MLAIKQISRSNLNEETISTVEVCKTTEDEIIALFRKPTDDYTRTQGDYLIYTYKGFAGRGKFTKQTLEVMINEDGIVVDKRLNQEDAGLMVDQCK